MTISVDARQIASAIERTRRSSKFCSSGTIPEPPGLRVDGLGEIRLPLRGKAAAELLAICGDAPYGKGTRTLVDKRVRKTRELTPSKFTLSRQWEAAIQRVTRQVADDLMLPNERLEARLYKLLVYDKGGFFLPHSDSEKSDRMVASIVVVLPSSFVGGELIVEHSSSSERFSFTQSASGGPAEFVAFYADCQHEVRQVISGVRVALAYNLVLKPSPRALKAPPSGSEAGRRGGDRSGSAELAPSIQQWTAARPAEPLVFALEHLYTPKGLKLDLLKGADRAAAELIVQAAEQSGCRVHLAQVSRHTIHDATDGEDYERSWYRRRAVCEIDTADLELGEVYEDEVTVDGWRTVNGKPVSIGPLPMTSTMLASLLPIEQWQPTSEDYEGYTGNAGNTLDRWYHKSAIVLWHDKDHFDVLTRAGVGPAIDLFVSMQSSLIKMPERRLEQACLDCDRLARAIIRRWPRQLAYYRDGGSDLQGLQGFAATLPKLEDPDLVTDLLRTISDRDEVTELDKLIPDACRRFGAEEIIPSLGPLLRISEGDSTHQSRRNDLPPRDVRWLNAVARRFDRDGIPREEVAELCRIGVDRFCAAAAADRRTPHAEKDADSLALLAEACVMAGADDALQQLLQTVQATEGRFDVRKVQVPALLKLVPRCQKQFGQVHPRISAWLENVRKLLKTWTARAPEPPADLARPVTFVPHGQYEKELQQFLLDPHAKTVRVAAREEIRAGLIHTIARNACDVIHCLDRSSRPFALRLTKTTASHERAVKRYDADLELLRSLPPS